VSAAPVPRAALALPRFVQIEPVGQCNLACRMCPVVFRGEGGPGRRPAFMEYETFCRLLAQFEGGAELQLQGLGEPMLHPRFFDMVRFAAQRGFVVSTNTNLTAFSPRRARECVESGLTRLHVSLDAADAAVYEAIRIGARFERMLRNLGWLMEARASAAGAAPAGALDVQIVCVLMRRNLGQLAPLVGLARRFGIRRVSVQALCHDFTEDTLPPQYGPMRRFVEDERIDREDPANVEREFDAARTEAQRSGVELRLPRVFRKEAAEETAVSPVPRKEVTGEISVSPVPVSKCRWPWDGAYVSYSGDAMPCCMVATPDRASFGNMARRGVNEVWNNEAYSRFRERLTSEDPPEVCRGCALYRGAF
jgi:radical SAM protein with 4Fe4S-binding SPASM domain